MARLFAGFDDASPTAAALALAASGLSVFPLHTPDGAGRCSCRGFGEAAILAALTEENRARCVPPLEPAEVERIARSVARYAPAPMTSEGRPRGARRPAFVEFVDGKVVAR